MLRSQRPRSRREGRPTHPAPNRSTDGRTGMPTCRFPLFTPERRSLRSGSGGLERSLGPEGERYGGPTFRAGSGSPGRRRAPGPGRSVCLGPCPALSERPCGEGTLREGGRSSASAPLPAGPKATFQDRPSPRDRLSGRPRGRRPEVGGGREIPLKPLATVGSGAGGRIRRPAWRGRVIPPPLQRPSTRRRVSDGGRNRASGAWTTARTVPLGHRPPLGVSPPASFPNTRSR
jgi:hypothetical protein